MTDTLEQTIIPNALYQQEYENGRKTLIRGYDITEVDPFNIAGKGGKSSIFSENRNDTDWLEFNDVITGTIEDTSMESSSMYEFCQTQSNTVKTGFSIPFLFSFKSQLTTAYFHSIEKQKRRSIAQAKKAYKKYSASLKTLVKEPPLNDEFILAVAQLPENIDSDTNKQCYMDFIRAYGTHYATWAMMGGKATFIRCFSSQQVKELTEKGISTSAGVSFEIKEASGSNNLGLKESTKKAYLEIIQNTYSQTRFSGGKPGAETFKNFLSTIEGNEAATDIKLEWIYSLFDWKALKSISNINTKKNLLEKTTKEYLKSIESWMTEPEELYSAEIDTKDGLIGCAYRRPSVVAIEHNGKKRIVSVMSDKDNKLCYLFFGLDEIPTVDDITYFDSGLKLSGSGYACVTSKAETLYTFYSENGEIKYLRGEFKDTGLTWNVSPEILYSKGVNHGSNVTATFIGERIAVAWKQKEGIYIDILNVDEKGKLISTLDRPMQIVKEGYNFPSIASFETTMITKGNEVPVTEEEFSDFVITYQSDKKESYYTLIRLNIKEKELELLNENTKIGAGKVPRVSSILNPLIIDDLMVSRSTVILVSYDDRDTNYRLGNVSYDHQLKPTKIEWKGNKSGVKYAVGYRPDITTFNNGHLVIMHNGVNNNDNLWHYHGELLERK